MKRKKPRGPTVARRGPGVATLLATLLATLMPAAGAYAQRVADGLAESYPQAQELGRRDESDDATRDYHRNVLLPEFSQRYRAHFRECTASVPEPQTTPFSFVAAIDADGRVQRVWSDRATNVFQCVRGRLLFDRFSPPPRAPFYLYIHMRFTN